jgi:hypothetical protein
VKLLSPGAEPRQTLRYQLAAGLKEKGAMILGIPELAVTVEGNTAPTQKLPSTSMTFDLMVAKVEPDGNIHYDFSLAKATAVKTPGVDAKVLSTMNKSLDLLRGFGGSGVVSSRGFNIDAKLNVPPGVPPELQQTLQGLEQSIRQLAAPLPEEPVGVGGRWQFTSPVTMNGLTLEQVATYEILKLTGTRVYCKVSVTQSAPKQTLSVQGQSIELISLKSNGGGTMEFETNHLCPSKSKVDVTSATEVRAQGQTTTMSMRLVAEIGRR